MRLVLVTLSCVAGLTAVQATSLVTVVKTVVEDKAVSSVDVSAAVFDNEPISKQAKASRRDEDGLLGDPSVTKVCITSPATTCLDLTLTDDAKPQDTKTEDPDDEDGWDDYTPPPTSTINPTEQSPPSISTSFTTASPSGPPVRNTGTPVTHSKEPEVYTAIPDWWPPTVGSGVDPDVERPKIPEIINPGWIPTNKPKPEPTPYCSVYPRPPDDPLCAEFLTPTQLIARATSVMN